MLSERHEANEVLRNRVRRGLLEVVDPLSGDVIVGSKDLRQPRLTPRAQLGLGVAERAKVGRPDQFSNDVADL